MKRFGRMSLVLIAAVLVAFSAASAAEGVFKIPFPFKAGGRSLPAGDYVVAAKGDGQLAVRSAAGGTEIPVPVLARLDQPTPPVADHKLVFNIVGNFEPSYTEYVTEYHLSELWQPGEKGYQTHILKGAHKTQEIKGEPAKK
jgi:hypothetical protein